MNGKLLFTATEARQNFFNLLKLASQGRKVVVKSKNSAFSFVLEKASGSDRKSKLDALKNLRRMNIKTFSPDKMGKIFESRYVLS